MTIKEYVKDKGWDGTIKIGSNTFGTLYIAYQNSTMQNDQKHLEEHPNWDGVKYDDGGNRYFFVNKENKVHNITATEFVMGKVDKYFQNIEQPTINQLIEKWKKQK